MESLMEKRRFLWKDSRKSLVEFVNNETVATRETCDLPSICDISGAELQSSGQKLANFLINRIQKRNYSQVCDWIKMRETCPDFNDILYDEAFQVDILSECQSLQSNSEQDLMELLKLISKLPVPVSSILFNDIFPTLRNNLHLHFIADYLRKYSPMDLQAWKHSFTETLIHHLTPKEGHFYSILNQPFLMLEILIMNRRITELKACLPHLRSALVLGNCGKCSSYEFLTDLAHFNSDHVDLPFTEGCLNKLLLFYAKYSVKVPLVKAETTTTPKECFKKPQWSWNSIDEEAQICMCCLRVKFTTPKGRHPCLRCKRSVPGTMKSVPSRVCKDCCKWAHSFPLMMIGKRSPNADKTIVPKYSKDNVPQWVLSGNKLTDTELRIKFSFNSIPDVELCLALLDLCTDDDESVSRFLVQQCDKYEDLMGPGRPEQENYIGEYGKLATVLQGLALAAKVRGSCEKNWELVIAKTEIVKKLVNLGREDLIPMENWNTRDSMKRMRNNLLNSKMFPIAFDMSIMCGFKTHRVLQAWGIECIKVENYYLAREKLSHSQSRIISTNQADRISKALIENEYPKEDLLLAIQRPKESPQIVIEILRVLEEKYDVEWEQESYYYLFLFGAHRDILKFLMRNQRWGLAFPYIIDHRLDFEDFLDAVILNSAVEMSEFELVVLMRGSNPSLEKWEPYLSKLCSLYERKNILENLYNIQASIQDDIRAALTCIKFFSNNCSNYRCFLQHGIFLEKAKFHFNRELKRLESNPSLDKVSRSSKLILEPKKIHFHLKKIELQKKITQFLVPFEDPFCGTNLLKIVERCSENKIETPLTIYDHRYLRYLLYLIVACDEKKGYELLREILASFPSIDQRSLYLFLIDEMFKHEPVDKTIEFTREVRMRSLQGHLVDNCIFQAIKWSRVESGKDREQLHRLINTIQNIHLRINSFIESGHLKTAYLLAVEYKDHDQLGKIAARAELTNQGIIKRLCDKHLTKCKS